RLVQALLAPLPAFREALRLGAFNVLKMGLNGLRSTASFARGHFRPEAARRVFPGLALHVDLGPHDLAGAGLGMVLGLLAADTGTRIPLGGAKAITQALLQRLQEHGGRISLGARVKEVLVR